MNFSDIFKNSFLKSYSNQDVSFQGVVICLLFCLLLSSLVCCVYYFKSRKYFFSKEFAVSIVALSIITAAVILTIQSSIVVSLGMVGALSIVRFRTAIKNPLDLVFCFWAITIGIICGAGINYIAVGLTLLLGVIILLSDEIPGVSKHKILVVDGNYPLNREELYKIIGKHCRYFNVRTETVHNETVNLIIELKGLKDDGALIDSLKELGCFHDISIIQQEGTID